MATRPETALCAICKEPGTDNHAGIVGSVGGGEQWRHDDQEAFITRGLAGDNHNFVPGKTVTEVEYVTAAEEKAAKIEKARREQEREEREGK